MEQRDQRETIKQLRIVLESLQLPGEDWNEFKKRHTFPEFAQIFRMCTRTRAIVTKDLKGLVKVERGPMYDRALDEVLLAEQKIAL